MDLEVGVSLEDIAVDKMHKNRLAGRRGSTHKNNALLKNPVVKTSNNWPRAPCWIASEPGVWWGGRVGRDKETRQIDKIK